jgi:hypothetical protein
MIKIETSYGRCHQGGFLPRVVFSPGPVVDRAEINHDVFGADGDANGDTTLLDRLMRDSLEHYGLNYRFLNGSDYDESDRVLARLFNRVRPFLVKGFVGYVLDKLPPKGTVDGWHRSAAARLKKNESSSAAELDAWFKEEVARPQLEAAAARLKSYQSSEASTTFHLEDSSRRGRVSSPHWLSVLAFPKGTDGIILRATEHNLIELLLTGLFLEEEASISIKNYSRNKPYTLELEFVSQLLQTTVELFDLQVAMFRSYYQQQKSVEEKDTKTNSSALGHDEWLEALREADHSKNPFPPWLDAAQLAACPSPMLSDNTSSLPLLLTLLRDVSMGLATPTNASKGRFLLPVTRRRLALAMTAHLRQMLPNNADLLIDCANNDIMDFRVDSWLVGWPLLTIISIGLLMNSFLVNTIFLLFK